MTEPEPSLAGEPIHPQPPTPESPRARRRSSELALRLATAAVLVPSVLWLIAQGTVYVLGAVIAIVLLGIREFYQLIEAKGAHPQWTFGMSAGAALPIVAYVGNEYHATILMTFALLGFMVRAVGKAQISEALASISGTFFGVFYVGWLLAHAVTLRDFHRIVAAKWGADAAAGYDPSSGTFLLVFALSAVVLCDAGAYFAGRKWGRRKLAPKISPGKTVEGALGGVAAGTIAALICKGVFDVFWPALSAGMSWAVAAPVGLVLSVAGMIGDLVESLLKRDAALKDAGTLLPGMGGVLDRIDSALLAIPVMYYLMLLTTYLSAGFR